MKFYKDSKGVFWFNDRTVPLRVCRLERNQTTGKISIFPYKDILLRLIPAVYEVDVDYFQDEAGVPYPDFNSFYEATWEFYATDNTLPQDLLGGGNSDLHYHDSDRARANHTGTQLASTISDFDTEVSNNADVLANTAKVSFPEAPTDGEIYGRINSTWEQIIEGDSIKVYYAESETESSTTSTTFQSKVLLNLPVDFEAGDYFIEVFYSWRGDNTNHKFKTQVQLDASPIGTNIQEQESKDIDNWHTSSRRFKRTLTAGVHTVELLYSTSNALMTAYISDASVSVTKIEIQ